MVMIYHKKEKTCQNFKGLIFICFIVFFAGVGQNSARAENGTRPLVIAHRGVSGYLPEHTLEAYAMAHGLNADYIEIDLVMTKDGHLICLHDIYLEKTTDVEQVFPEKQSEGGHFYAADLTLSEIKKLSVHERLDGRFPQNFSKFEVPTFIEMIELVQGLNKSRRRIVGIYPELKKSQWHRSRGFDLEKTFMEILAKYEYLTNSSQIIVQSFEPECLKRMKQELNSPLRQVQLIGSGQEFNDLVTQEGLKNISDYADGIGPNKNRIENNPDLVIWAHEKNLGVYPYTFRADQVPDKYANFEEEVRQFLSVYKVDGLFTDFPDLVYGVLVPVVISN